MGASVHCGGCKTFVDKHRMEKMGENDIAVLERSMTELSLGGLLSAEDSDDETPKYKKQIQEDSEYRAFQQRTRSAARPRPY